MPPISIKGERELPLGRSVLIEEPQVIVNVGEDAKSGYLELPTSGVIVKSQETIEGEVTFEEPLTPPRLPIYVSERGQVEVSHPETGQSYTLVWEPSGEEVQKRIEWATEDRIQGMTFEERFPLSCWVARRYRSLRDSRRGFVIIAAAFIDAFTTNMGKTAYDRITRRWRKDGKNWAKAERRTIRDYYAEIDKAKG